MHYLMICQVTSSSKEDYLSKGWRLLAEASPGIIVVGWPKQKGSIQFPAHHPNFHLPLTQQDL